MCAFAAFSFGCCFIIQVTSTRHPSVICSLWYCLRVNCMKYIYDNLQRLFLRFYDLERNLVSSTSKTDHHAIIEILLRVTLNIHYPNSFYTKYGKFKPNNGFNSF